MLLIAHRGASAHAPENTLAALDLALRHGADAIEVDTQATLDGDLVLLHDADFRRTAGVGLRPAEMTLAEVRTLEVGRWLGPEHAGERVPTLAEALALVGGRVPLFVEVKAGRDDRRAVAERLAEVLRAAPGRHPVSSGDRLFLREWLRIEPRSRPGLVLAAPTFRPNGLRLGSYSQRAARCSERFVRFAHARGREVHLWTVNDPRRLARLRRMGVDGVFTDDPARLRAAGA